MNPDYTYSETGLGVHAYVIDTGIHVTHTDFGGRATGVFTAISDGHGTDDCAGHGTHVSGTIGGTNYGIAKQVSLFAVRVLDCTGSGTVSGAIAGVQWVTNNAIHPAVANMSLAVGGLSPSLDSAVTASIASGVTYAVAAANNNAPACNYSPADVPTAITVGAIDPTNDTRASFSDYGTCVKLFGPGVNILSDWFTSNTATNTLSGTSMATPHVTGVAARYLQTHLAASPAAVWAAIHAADDVFPTTVGWPGIINPGTGSPNELLHWGSLNNGVNDGDPHLTTVSGIQYDFQGAGEFVALRDGNGLDIQTRQTPVATAPPDANGYTGLKTCVSVNTAVAARVGTRRVTYQSNLSSNPASSGLQLRVDGILTPLPANGLNLGPGARVVPSANGVIQIDFPDGTSLTVTPGWWGAPENTWYLNLSVFNTPDTEGLMGATAPGSWLPALSNGTSLGPMPAALHQRYVDLLQTFANAWRVTNATSLFDYAPGTSTATFTLPAWPPENPPCVLPKSTPPKPLAASVAEKLCSTIVDKVRHANCVFDATFTGEPGFAKTYLVSQRIEAGSTTTRVDDNKDPTLFGEAVTFTASVALRASSGKTVPTGTVQFILDGKNAGALVKLDAKGWATWKTSSLAVGKHEVAARYTAAKGSVFLASSSLDTPHTVVKEAAK